MKQPNRKTRRSFKMQSVIGILINTLGAAIAVQHILH